MHCTCGCVGVPAKPGPYYAKYDDDLDQFVVLNDYKPGLHARCRSLVNAQNVAAWLNEDDLRRG